MKLIKVFFAIFCIFIVAGCNPPYISTESGSTYCTVNESSFSHIISANFIRREVVNEKNIDLCEFTIEERIKNNGHSVSSTNSIVTSCSFGKIGDVVYFDLDTNSIRTKVTEKTEENANNN